MDAVLGAGFYSLMGQHLRLRRKEDRGIVGFTLVRDHFSCGVYREVGRGRTEAGGSGAAGPRHGTQVTWSGGSR